jgi:hypothetical protein
VLVFPRFVKGATGNQPKSALTVRVTCPRPVDGNGPCPIGDGVKIRAHWVCPPATNDSLSICKATNFNLHPVGGTVRGPGLC